MNRLASLAASTALLTALSGCAPSASSPPARPLTATQEIRAAVPGASSPEPHSVLLDETPPETPSAMARALAGVLRPIDSPLPTRASLERGYSDPVGILLELSATSWPDRLVRENALSELGLFPENEAAMARLMEVAIDDSRPATERGGAINGLILAGEAIEPSVPALLPLLSSEELIVQASAVRLLGPWPAARGQIRRLADDEGTHTDVRRFAKRALEADAAK